MNIKIIKNPSDILKLEVGDDVRLGGGLEHQNPARVVEITKSTIVVNRAYHNKGGFNCCTYNLATFWKVRNEKRN